MVKNIKKMTVYGSRGGFFVVEIKVHTGYGSAGASIAVDDQLNIYFPATGCQEGEKIIDFDMLYMRVLPYKACTKVLPFAGFQVLNHRGYLYKCSRSFHCKTP